MKTLLTATLTLSLALMFSISSVPLSKAVAQELPYTFFFTHCELLGDPDNPEGVRYHSNGKPFAKAPDGSTITLSGQGGWDPSTKTAEGGGQYTIKDASGAVTAQGSWQVTDFLENQGDGVLVAWCIMPGVSPKPDDHQGDGISLTGDDFNFTGFRENEMSLEGVMFYSTDPASDGYVLTSEGHTVRKTATVPSTTTATASPLPTSGGPSLVWPLALVAALALVGSGVAALALLRRGLS